MTENQRISSPKQHYVVLDSLRGVAAVVVVFLHYMEYVFWPDYSKMIVTHGFLAVDFFFCLSGFVIAYAYDERMGKIGIKQFFINRLVRLHPLVILGSILGVVLFFVNPFADPAADTAWGQILRIVIFSLLLIPSPGGLNKPDLFPLNPPAWSLFFEYIANVVYALVLCRIRRGWLVVLGVVSAAWLCYCASQAGWTNGGWEGASFFTGLARVACSFTLGLLVYRYNLILKNRLGVWLPTLLLLAPFFIPHLPNDWITEVAFILLLFPLIVGLGAGTAVSGLTHRFCSFLGRMSYPIYMTHYPVVMLFGFYYGKYHPSGIRLTLVICSLFILNMLVAYAALRWFDEPVRKWLRAKMAKER